MTANCKKFFLTLQRALRILSFSFKGSTDKNWLQCLILELLPFDNLLFSKQLECSPAGQQSGHVSKREKHILIAGNSGQMNRSVLSNADTFKYLSSTFKRHKKLHLTYSQKTLQMLNLIYTSYHSIHVQTS